MPEAAKKPPANAKVDVKAPLIGSPAKGKSSAAPGKTVEKEAVKLPSIGSSPASPSKKSIKSEVTPTALPNGAPPKVSTPTSPSKGKAITNAAGSQRPNRSVKGLNDASNGPSAQEQKDSLPNVADSGIASEQAPTEDTMNSPTQAEVMQVAEIEAAAAQAAAEAAAAAAAAQAEAERIRKENGNGMVQLIYEQYDELFPIVDGSTTQAAIDDVYCLSFVMPNCLVHLSLHPNAERFERENSGIFDSLVHEEPRGVYHDLAKDQIYYVVVEQEEDQLKRDQEATKAKWAPAIKSEKEKKDDGRGFETCSCIYGNPCVDEYGCKDWHSRFAIATANGWKGF